MSNVLYPIPIYKINGVDARKGGEWPGRLPCHFKSSKCIIRPPDSDIFSKVINPAIKVERLKKRQIIRESSKEYVFRSCSRSVPPIERIEKSQSLKIFPKSYMIHMNIFKEDREMIKAKPINAVVEKPKTRLRYSENTSREELSEIITEELKLQREHAKLQKIFKEIPNRDLLKKRMKNKSNWSNIAFFKSQLDFNRNANLNNSHVQGIKEYSEVLTNRFDSKLPKVK